MAPSTHGHESTGKGHRHRSHNKQPGRKEPITFRKYPSSAFDLDSETKALVFLGGKFKSRHEEDGKERYLAVALTVYNDGLVANTESSTSDTDEFLEGLIQSAVTEFGLVHPGIRKKLYFSEMDVRLDRPIRLINPRLQQLASRISELRGDTNPIAFEFSGVTFLPEPTAQAAVSGFSLERKVNTDWSESRYYTRAPLQTDAHLKILEEFGALLA